MGSTLAGEMAPSKAKTPALPACFALTGYTSEAEAQQAAATAPGKHRLHGADDLISLFGLQPLWDRSVRPYMSLANTRAASRAETSADGAAKTDAQDVKPNIMDKTYGAYVQDLPGKVRPNKKAVNRYNASVTSANAAGMAPPAPPMDLAGRTTMRDIVFRPETTVQRVGPFEDETLHAAFTVAAGDVADIDLSLLESDGPDRQSPSKRKKKRKHQREPGEGERGDDSVAAKRSKLQALVGTSKT